MKTNSSLEMLQKYLLINLNVIIGGTTDGGETDKKKLKLPSNG